MKIHEIVFSNHPGFRVLRHGGFWTLKFLMLVVWTLKGFYHNLPDETWSGASMATVNPLTDPVLYLNLLTDMIFCYSVWHWLWPLYLMQKKYGPFVLITLSLAIGLHFIKYIFTFPLNSPSGIPSILWEQSLEFLRSGPMGVCVFFVTIKLIKEWHIKQEEKQMLFKENEQAELQLLKAQVHPHFLFNTLNSIYSFTLAQSSQAADLVSKLSNMMRYMITSGESVLVPLEKELKMIHDYIALEKVRYGSRLDMTVAITGESTNKLIAPMLMIPFVENAFKHGAGKTWLEPWIRLSIEIKNDNLYLQLNNSKPPGQEEHNGKNGIGLVNIQKRLQLLYPGKHDLKLWTSYDSFMMRLRVPLLQPEAASVSDKTIPSGKSQPLTYARS